MNTQEINVLVQKLYQAVDNKDLDYLDNNLANQVRFRLGNNPVVTDKSEILQGNKQFFSSIESMRHSIEDVVYQLCDSSGTIKASCYGTVNYVRLDGSEYSAVFSTFLTVQNGLITDYLIFADLSGL
ncbi:nuclear transport factor 2 family protein [uncultured Shewanella sp.]|uniref:nuclear transport factor 2 family protein n=1 Tax=uncultured Shewanella sp. TaxID=173975 RepID=UPI0026162080|nr:nuclear transport factor 2 family protein [uncultured Shewanella sp.]